MLYLLLQTPLIPIDAVDEIELMRDEIVGTLTSNVGNTIALGLAVIAMVVALGMVVKLVRGVLNRDAQDYYDRHM